MSVMAQGHDVNVNKSVFVYSGNSTVYISSVFKSQTLLNAQYFTTVGYHNEIHELT